VILGFVLLGAGGAPPATPPAGRDIVVALGASGGRLRVSGPLLGAVGCEPPADPAVVAALRAGVVLPWRAADRLLPSARLERALVRDVVARAATAAVCDGVLVVTDPIFEIRGARGAPVEIVLASALRPSVAIAVHPDDLTVSPPDGAWRVTARDEFTAYGTWALGCVGACGARAE